MAKVLIKERPAFDLTDLCLIKDPPVEILHQNLVKYKEDNKQATILAKQKGKEDAKKDALKSWKRVYAKLFLYSCEKFLDVSPTQLKELIVKLSDPVMIELIENNFLRRLKRRALLASLVWFLSIYLFVGQIAIFGGIVQMEQNNGVFILFGAFFGIYTLFFLGSFSLHETNAELLPSIPYLWARRRLKKLYGFDYFPVQELKEKLDLVEKQEISEVKQESYDTSKVFNH